MSSHIKFIIFIITIVVLGALPAFLQYGDYLFFSDYLNQEIPFIIETKRMLGSGCPLWSWNTYLGQNFIGAYSFYTLTSPFVWINCLFPEQWIIKSIFFTLILKYICAYFTSYFYFRKMYVSAENSRIGGILYAFSSYAITNLYYYHFFEPLIVFPLLLIALERFFRKERYSMSLLILASFLVTFINFYFSICSFIAAALYSLCRLLSSEIKITLKHFGTCIFCVIIGILIDSFILFPSIITVTGSTRVGGLKTGFDYTWIWVMIERIRNFVMPQIIEGSHSVFRHTGYGSTSLCIAVLGIFPAILYCIKCPKNWLTILFVVFSIFYITPLNSLFSLFTDDNYTRWGYALCLVIILLSVKYLDISEKPKAKYYMGYIAFSIIIFILAIHRHGIESPNESRTIILTSYITLFFINLLCLAIWCFNQKRKILYISIGICVVIQMCTFHSLLTDVYWDHVKKIHGVIEKNEYGIIGKSISNNLKNSDLPKLEGDMKYRSIFHGGMLNSGMITNRACDVSMHSISNFEASRFYMTSDTTWHPENTTSHNCNIRSYYAVSSVSDFIVYNDTEPDFLKTHRHVTKKYSHKDYSIYTNNDYIPIGFTYDSYVPESLIDSINNKKPKPDVPLLLLTNLSIPDEKEKLFSKYMDRGKLSFDVNIDSVINERKRNCSSQFCGTTTGFKLEINMPKTNFVFFSVPHNKGFTAFVDSIVTPIQEVNLGLCAVLVPKGFHKIEFKFCPSGLLSGTYVSMCAFIFLLLIIYMESRKKLNRN